MQMSDLSKVVFLDQAEWLEFHPTLYTPVTGDEKLAAVVGYMIGDGAIALRSQKYTKKDGTTSVYPARMVGAFYSNCERDLVQIHQCLISLGIGAGVSVTKKKASAAHLEDGYQLQLAHPDCAILSKSGVPVGKKTTQTFDVPEWIMGGDLPTKRAFVSALFGAEGSTPSGTGNTVRTMRPITMTMCKIDPTPAGAFFLNVQKLLRDLGVDSSLTTESTTRFDKPYVNYTIRICGIDNVIAYCANVGFVFCDQKGTLAWQWLQYLRAYKAAAKNRRDTILQMSEDGFSWKEIGLSIGITRGAAHRLFSDIKAGKGVTAGHSFPQFQVWIKERWDESRRLLRLKVVSRVVRPEPQEVWNLLVSSHDHSYLLANGANNFNSFETMSGRVYHAFDRKVHVKSCPFNPNLPIWIGQDFNIDPMSSVILQPQLNGEVWIVSELSLKSSNTAEVVDKLEQRYFRQIRNVSVYPDPAGGYRQHARGETDLDIFRQKGFRRIRHRAKHPPVADRVNCVNRMWRAADGTVRMYVDPSCEGLIQSVEQTIYKEGSRDVDKAMNIEHLSDALGYPIEFMFPMTRPVIAGISL